MWNTSNNPNGEVNCGTPIPSNFKNGFSSGSVVNNLPASAGDTGDMGLILDLGRSPEEGNGYALQFSYLENSMDRGTWWATVHGFAKELDTN